MKEEIKNKPPQANHCPQLESISAFFDRELDPSTAEYSHISSCPKCQSRLSSYMAIDKSLKKSFPTPDGLAENTMKGVRAKLEMEKRRGKGKLLFFPLLRVAALFIIGGVAFYILGHGLFERKTYKNPEGAQITEKHGNALSSKFEPVSTGNLPLDSLMNVNFGEAAGMPPIPELPENAAQAPVPIAAQVLHVWTAKTPANAESQFKTLAKKIGINENALKISLDGAHLKIFCQLSKKQLVQLVRLCAANGFELLSPQAPQPEQKFFTGSPSDHVQYLADIVLDGN